ncbi:hypothetical protein [Pararhodonellum marinum]|uniref:hypothetical protein n=1 Tax=Pararhodonellum marinum TaxID=2755358 RepID=UPI00188E09FC|nr:hypothetical protein [Pararhodonellum marinum]
MKKITIKIPNHKYAFFMELIQNLGLEKVKSEGTREEVIKGIKQGFKEMNLNQEGESNGNELKDFLDDL